MITKDSLLFFQCRLCFAIYIAYLLILPAAVISLLFLNIIPFFILVISSILFPSLYRLLVLLIPVMEAVELKVEMVGIHEKRLRKCLSKLKGIEKVEVDGNSQKVVVTGYAHRNKILKAVRRAGLRADFWSAQNELLNAYANSSASTSYGAFRFNNFSFF